MAKESFFGVPFSDVTQEDLTSFDFLNEQGIAFEGLYGGSLKHKRRHQVNQLLQGYLAEAFRLGGIEDDRDAKQLGFERGEFNRFNEDFEGRQGRLSNLFRSRAADDIGAQTRQGLRGLRSFVGSRGLNPNSGTVAQLVADIGSRQRSAFIGAQRDIALDEERRRRDHSLARLQGSQRIGDLISKPPSALRLDAIGDVINVQRGREGEAEAKFAASQARKDAKVATGVSIGTSIAGAFV